MDEFTKKKIEAIDAEISEHYKKVRELSNLKFKFEYQENIEYANSLVGKYFKRDIPAGGIEVLHPVESSTEDNQVIIIGFQAQGTIFTPGDMNVFIHTKEFVSVREFKENNYIEIEKEEYTELLSGFLDFDA
jgi:hypothetical protein